MQYDVVTIDTQVVDSNGFNFNGGLLAQLKQFSGGSTEVVVSEVVAKEILKHVLEKTKNANDNLSSSYKKAYEFGLIPTKDTNFPIAIEQIRELAKSRVRKFFEEMSATVIDFDEVTSRELVSLYFRSGPPFAASGKKKSEFPDALALLSLEKWAQKHDKRILAVSNDPDWAAYAKLSPRIDIEADLGNALARLQRDAEDAANYVLKVLTDIENGKAGDLLEEYRSLLKDAIENIEIPAIAESSHEIDSGMASLDLVRDRFDLGERSIAFDVVRAGPKTIVARVPLIVDVKASSTFDLSVYDYVDHEVIPMGSVSSTHETEIEISVLLTLEGEFSGGTVSISDIEIVGVPDAIDFGYFEVEPDSDFDDAY